MGTTLQSPLMDNIFNITQTSVGWLTTHADNSLGNRAFSRVCLRVCLCMCVCSNVEVLQTCKISGTEALLPKRSSDGPGTLYEC